MKHAAIHSSFKLSNLMLSACKTKFAEDSRTKEKFSRPVAEKTAKIDVHEYVYRDTTMKITNKMHYID
jgi:hypothetical protein